MLKFFFSSRRRHTRSKRDWSSDVCSSDLDERTAGFHDSENFAHVTGQVGPLEVCFHGRDEIEHAVRKRQLRNRAVPDLDAAEIYPSYVGSLCCGYALVGIIDAVDFSLRSNRR